MCMKKKALSYYLDLMKSALDKQEWIKVKQYGEIALQKLSNLFYSPMDKYLLYCRLGYVYSCLTQCGHSLDMFYAAYLTASRYHLNPEQIAYSAFMLGLNLLNVNRLNQAIIRFQEVETYYQKYGDEKSTMDKRNHFLTLIYLSACYLYKGDFGKAEEIIEKKLPAYQKCVAKFSEYYRLKGEYLIRKKEYDQARHTLNECIKITPADEQVVIACRGHLAVIDLLDGKLDSAIDILENLIKDARRLKFNHYFCAASLVLGKCYLLKSTPGQPSRYVAKAASVEKAIAPLLNSLDITWFHAQSVVSEELYYQLQSIYQNPNLPVVPEIITSNIEKYYQSSPYANIIVGKSNSLMEVLQLVEKIAPTDLPILIQGETGTGKELIAQALHKQSPRKGKPFLVINCGAMPETLLENELFGHSKGAFTDAHENKKGYIELATNGSLFLDEINDMPLAMQQKILRVLEENLVWKLGSEKPVPVNTRFIFSSNQDIERLVKTKRFREDLYYRINTIVITVPPLRDRKDDIPLLVEHFLKKYSAKIITNPPERFSRAGDPRYRSGLHSVTQLPMTNDVLNFLMNYNWPGNVRELENEIRRICTLYPDTPQINESMLSEKTISYSPESGSIPDEALSLKELKDIHEKNIIIKTLRKYNGNIAQTARSLRCPRCHLQRNIKQLHIDKNIISLPKSNTGVSF